MPQKINPLKVTFKTVQQDGLQTLLEHYLEQHYAYMEEMDTQAKKLSQITSILIEEWLIKVKQRNLLNKQQTTFALSPALRIALTSCWINSVVLNPLALSVHVYLTNENQKQK